MTRLPCISRPAAVQLMDAAAEASRAGDGTTALTHLLAASEVLDADGRPADARKVRDLARRLGLELRPEPTPTDQVVDHYMRRVRDAHEVG